MWRVARRILVPLVIGTMAVVGVMVGPSASAAPEGEAVQAYGQPPLWGSCAALVGDAAG